MHKFNHSIVRKLGRPKIRHCVKEYYRLYRSKIIRKYLTEKSIRYIIAQCKQGRRTATIAYEMNVTQRHIQRIWAEFRKTGVPHVQKTPGRHSSAPSEAQTNLVLQKHKEQPIGAVYLGA